MDKNTSIIVVDDETYLTDIFREWFMVLGCRFRTVNDPVSALEILGKESFDIMLTDVMMPGMRGFELTEKAKKLQPDMTVILMTGYDNVFSYENALDSGAADFIKKPFTLDEMKTRIKIVQLHKELRSLAITDDMTGVYNRRGFLTLGEHLLKLAKRNRTGMFLLFADLDNLKQINDRFGHDEGDQALIELAGTLKSNYRESDIIARLGGDEFVILPVGTCDDCTEIIVERLNKSIQRLNDRLNRKYQISISFGLSFFDPEKPCSLAELVSIADKEMYQMKKSKIEPAEPDSQ